MHLTLNKQKMIFTVITYILTAIIGATIGIFFYRNNVDLVDPIADKVDEKWDEKIKPTLESLEDKLEKLTKEIEDLKK